MVGNEWMTMLAMHEASAPKPLATEATRCDGYVGDEDAAPQLNRVRCDPTAKSAFDTVMRNIELMLKHNLVHGDLSSHNILWWHGRVTIIDFPQAVDARFNSNAHEFLRRDLANVCEYFQRQGIEADPLSLADGLWDRFTLGEL